MAFPWLPVHTLGKGQGILLKHPDQALGVYHSPPLIPLNLLINRATSLEQILTVIIICLPDTPNMNQISIQFGTQQV